MKLKTLALLCAGAFPLLAAAADPTVERYVVTFAPHDRLAYQGAYAGNFQDGLPIGVGSGLFFIKKEGAELIFATVTDRGPNADAPKVGQQEAKIFPQPAFAPLLMTIRVGAGQAQATQATALHDAQGAVSGLPLPPGLIGATHEVALSDTLQQLPSDRRGLDTEGITSDGQGGYWLSDEYGPFLLHTDANGKILQKYGPQPGPSEQSVATGLPNILQWRQPNRGFEGITRMPDGRIMAAVQSTLDVDGKSKNSALFTRLLSFDPISGKTAMYAYPIDSDAYKKAKDAKIGDIVALDQHRLLLIEQGKDKNKQLRNLVYVVDLRDASDLTDFDLQRAAEFDDASQLQARGIRLATKKELVDLRQLGWQHEKAEGMALVDQQTIAISNDNDFGLQAVLEDMDDYQADGKGQLTKDGKPVKAKIELQPLQPSQSQSALWLIKMPAAIK